MSKTILSVALLLTVLMWCVPAFPLAAGHPTGHPVGQHPEWPSGLADLLNSPWRVHGYFINACDFFFYSGDTDGFNQFLEQYAGLKKTPLTLVLQPGRGKTDFCVPGDKEISFDWRVDLLRRGWAREAPPDPTGKAGNYVVMMALWAGGQVELNKVKVPLSVKVKAGDADQALAQFAAAHAERRKQAEREDTRTTTPGAEAEAEAPRTTKVEEATLRFIDLDPYVTASLEAFHGGVAGSDLPLEPGKARIGGNDFRIGKGVIHLGGSILKVMPNEVKEIKVGLKFNRLRILHGTGWDVAQGTRIGSYVMHYDDGASIEIPVEYGVHVKDWWTRWGDTSEVSGGEVAWTGGTEVAPPLRLYLLTWANPDPEKAVRTIDCTSTGTECAPFVVAMTAEKGGAVATTIATEGAASADYRSQRPRYAKMALSGDGSKVLSIVFDESRGTGVGYDLLYADANFNGRFEKGESFKAGTLERDGKVISSSFPPIELNVPYEKEGGTSAQWHVAFGYHAPRSSPRVRESVWVSETPSVTAGTFHVTARLRARRDSTEWRYFLGGPVEPSESLEAAPVWRVASDPGLKVTTRPDGRKKGNLGIGLELPVGENELVCHEGGSRVRAHVEIKKPDGTAVHKGDETLDKFVFG